MHGNPFLRLLRHEVEALVENEHGPDHLRDQQAKTELAGINRDLKKLKKQLAELEARKSKLLADRGRDTLAGKTMTDRGQRGQVAGSPTPSRRSRLK